MSLRRSRPRIEWSVLVALALACLARGAMAQGAPPAASAPAATPTAAATRASAPTSARRTRAAHTSAKTASTGASARTASPGGSATAAKSAAAKDGAPRRLTDVHIEGEMPVPQVLFITARDQRRYVDFQHQRYLRDSRALGAATATPTRVTAAGDDAHH